MTAPQQPEPPIETPFSGEAVVETIVALEQASEQSRAQSQSAGDPMRAGGYLGRAVWYAKVASTLRSQSAELGRLRDALQQREQDSERLSLLEAVGVDRIYFRDGEEMTCRSSSLRAAIDNTDAILKDWARGVSSGPPAGDEQPTDTDNDAHWGGRDGADIPR